MFEPCNIQPIPLHPSPKVTPPHKTTNFTLAIPNPPIGLRLRTNESRDGIKGASKLKGQDHGFEFSHKTNTTSTKLKTLSIYKRKKTEKQEIEE
ncbi:hypothetical protein Tco_1007552 [Tanacetum coccineum]